MTLKDRLNRTSQNIETIDTFAVDTLSRLATWTAPLVPAAMVYHAAQAYIPDVGPVQAFVAAASIELLGIQVTANWLTAGEFNRHSDERRPMVPYVAMLAAYVFTVLAIVIGLKVAPETVSWLAIVMLSLLTLLSATAFVQRRQLSADMEHLSAIEDEKHRAELRSLRKATKAQISQPMPQTAHNFGESAHDVERANAARLTKIEQRQNEMLELLRTQGPITTGDLASALQVSPNTVRSYLESFNGQVRGDGRSGWHLAE